MPSLLFIAPLPPGFHGQAIASADIAERLETTGWQVVRCDTNARGKGGAAVQLRRLARLARSVWLSLAGHHDVSYISVNANRGMWVTALQAWLARVRGKPIFLHHHTNAHVNRPTRAARALVSWAGTGAVHIVICPEMEKDLRALYPGVRQTLSLSNVRVAGEPLNALRSAATAPFRLGHLSNLTEEKGCLRAIEAFRLAQSRGLARELTLAGPASDPDLRARIDQACAESAGAIRYLGPVYGAQKSAFFETIDIFLFPSLYPNETQGIVNLEALREGVPVIAYGLCCIKSDLSVPCCEVVDPASDFAEASCRFLTALTMSYAQRSLEAKARFIQLAGAGEAQFALLEAAMRKASGG